MFTRRQVLGGASYKEGDRIAQIMILPVQEVEFKEVKKLTSSERGEGGFGSTGN